MPTARYRSSRKAAKARGRKVCICRARPGPRKRRRRPCHPEALPPGSPRGAVPVTPELKPEELKALEFYEKAAAAMQDARPSTWAWRALLAPHALRRHRCGVAAWRPAASEERPRSPCAGTRASPRRRPCRRRSRRQPGTGGPDVSGGDGPPLPNDATILEALYTFAVRHGRARSAEHGSEAGDRARQGEP